MEYRNYIFIDTQNVIKVLQQEKWKIDWKKFYIYLKEKWKILLSPNQKTCAYFLKKAAKGRIMCISDIKKKIQRKSEPHPVRTNPKSITARILK
jgi:hypothetical protein